MASTNPHARSLDPNVLNYYTLDETAAPRTCRPAEILSPNRIDVIARYLYIKHLYIQDGIGWGTEVYKNLLECWNRDFYDGDGRKTLFGHYLCNLTALAESFRTDGFLTDKGLLPIAGDTLVDGAHRYSAALYFDRPIDIIPVDGPRQVQDAPTLRRIGMRRSIVENLVSEYCRLDEHTVAFFLFPDSFSRLGQCMEVLRSAGTVIYTKDITLTDLGRERVIRLLYGMNSWWREDLLAQFIALRFGAAKQLRVVFMKLPSGTDYKLIKKDVRGLFPIPENGAIHSNDTREEMLLICRTFLNRGSIHHLNYSLPQTFEVFGKLLPRYKEQVDATENPEAYCVDSSAVLSAYGIRDCNDIDYIMARPGKAFAEGDLISCHNEEYADFPIPIGELVYNPDFHFYHNGVKFLSLHAVEYMKRLRNAEKDLLDVALIRSFSAAQPYGWNTADLQEYEAPPPPPPPPPRRTLDRIVPSYLSFGTGIPSRILARVRRAMSRLAT